MLYDLWLQLFADGGNGGDGATGANPDDAGQGRTQADDLRELGVPEEKIRQRYKDTKSARQTNPQQTATAPEGATETTGEAPTKRMTWEEIMADPEYNKAMQETVQKRVKENKDQTAKTANILELLAQKYGIKDANDYDGIAKALEGDDDIYEQKALDLGVSVDVARKMDALERQVKRDEQTKRENEEAMAMQKHYQGLLQQEAALKAKVPNFNLQMELQNPNFLRLTSPQVGMNVEDAFYAIHHNDIERMQIQQRANAMNDVAARTAQAMSANVQAGYGRPQENASQNQAASLGKTDFKKLTREQRAEIRHNAELAKARGEVYIPDFMR